ncbi:hypothetical protein GCM10012275_33360 [Longimycelium tulufanense]|uniref:OmpR/PhoB-type domain-containing protein n=1 Tax=Longimycelium tulufanense TaxID=907463 RepID=A0A8J3CFG5_9PSEU|nr:AfsR/SARP family transcriptional regulator [Longimycelium tulufanense]GGM59572.1 hypothetical protein GCM10012275_33360 [Longimycelium tulufanense]
MNWRFGVLGPLELRTPTEVRPISAPQQRRVLTTLLLNAGQLVGVPALLSALWEDEPPATGRKAVQVYVSQLRHLLADAPGVTITGSRQGYRLQIPPGSLDLYEFRDLVRRATTATIRPTDPAVTADLLRQALDLWRGTPAPDLGNTCRGQRLCAALEEERLTALEHRIDADLRAGRHRDLVPELMALVAEQPLRERLRGQLMLALHHSGRQADALAVFAEGKRQLADELGLDPGLELRELHTAILTGDLPSAPANTLATITATKQWPMRLPRKLPANLEPARLTLTPYQTVVCAACQR